MRAVIDWLRREPGLGLLVLALLAAAAIYAPTLGYGLVNYDDPWLLRDNWIVQHPSAASLHAILFDTSQTTRFVLGAEYLPVRDLSTMLDFAIWGTWWQGFHITNLALYLAAIAVWFSALDAFEIDRTALGLAMLIWALHPTHAESVAWLAERKGLLGAVFSGVSVLGYGRWRAGRSAGWLALASIAAICAVWSKAPAAFAVATIAVLELALPARRTSWRRSVTGLGVIGVAGALAFVPVLLVAANMSVVGATAHAPAGRLAMTVGVHGLDVELAAMVIPNAATYPLASDGPSVFNLVIGAIGLVLALAVAFVPRRGRWSPPAALRAAAGIWLVGWLPSSHAILPVHTVLVADRYLLIPTLGFALALALGVTLIASRRARIALAVTIGLASTVRAIDARSNWRDARTLWERAVSSDPRDGEAWSMYADALIAAHMPMEAADAVARGLANNRSPRLLLRKALMYLERGESHERGIELMREAAVAGEPRAMSNLALLLLPSAPQEALEWARRSAAAAPIYVNAQRTLGKVALATEHASEALDAFEHAYALEPQNLANRFNLGLALLALHRAAEAVPHFEACEADPAFAARAREQLAIARGQ